MIALKIKASTISQSLSDKTSLRDTAANDKASVRNFDLMGTEQTSVNPV
jgi:hypothetical protein